MNQPGDLLKLTEKIDQFIYALGLEECERRLERKIDGEFLNSLFTVDEDGNLSSTKVVEEVIRKLSQ